MDIEIRDERPTTGRATIYRADIEHPNAADLSARAWHLLMLVATYADGNPDGWRLDRAHLASKLRCDPRHVTAASAELRRAGYLQTYRRTLPKMDGKRWIVGPAKLTGGQLDVSDGLEGCPQWTLRSPWSTYRDGPDDVITVIVDSLDPRPGRWRTLRTLRNWRVPDVGGGKEAPGRIRQVGATLAELAARGLAPNGARRVVPIGQVTPAELVAVVGFDEAIRAGVYPSGERLEQLEGGAGQVDAAAAWLRRAELEQLHGQVAELERLRAELEQLEDEGARLTRTRQGKADGGGVDGSIQGGSGVQDTGTTVQGGAGRIDPAPHLADTSQGGSKDPGGQDRSIQHGEDRSIQPTSSGSSFPFHRPLVEPPASLGSMHVAGRAVPVERLEEWQQLCHAVVDRITARSSTAVWRVALADVASPDLVRTIADELSRGQMTIGKVRRIGPWSVSEAIREVRRAWLDGAIEIPALPVGDPDRDGAILARLVDFADAYDVATDEDEIQGAIDASGLWGLLTVEGATLRARAELAGAVRDARRRCAELATAPEPPRNGSAAGDWLRRATAIAHVAGDVERAAAVERAGTTLERLPWAWSTWLRTARAIL